MTDRDAPRLEALQQAFSREGFRLIVEGRRALKLFDRDDRLLAAGDWEAGTFVVAGMTLTGRQDFDGDRSYDAMSDVEHPLQPDLLLMQQLAFSGARFQCWPGWDPVLTSPARLRWPVGAERLRHPALIDPNHDWYWPPPGDPLWTMGTDLEGGGDAWIVDLPALLPTVRTEDEGTDRAGELRQAVSLRAERQGLRLTELPGAWATWLVHVDDQPRGIIEIEAGETGWRLHLIGRTRSLEIRNRSFWAWLRRRAPQGWHDPWAEVFDEVVPGPIFVEQAWETS